jgi:hypothetical protein
MDDDDDDDDDAPWLMVCSTLSVSRVYTDLQTIRSRLLQLLGILDLKLLGWTKLLLEKSLDL